MDTAAYSLLAHPDQWARCRHEDTALMPSGGVQLSWRNIEPEEAGPGAAHRLPPGLAFDRWGNAYRSHPEEDRVSVRPPTADATCATDLDWAGTYPRPSALAVDADQRLYVVQDGGARIAVVDLWARGALRRIPVATQRHPRRRSVDVAARCCEALVLTRWPAQLIVVAGRRGPLPGPPLVRPRCRGAVAAVRVTVAPDGTVLVLWDRADLPPLIADSDGRPVVEVPSAVDLVARADGTLAVACRPGLPLRRFAPLEGAAPGAGVLELDPLALPGFDGGSVTESYGRLSCTTADGNTWAGGPSIRYLPAGRVVTYRLDSGAYRTRWGRVFLDACLPPGTGVTVRSLTSDHDEVADPVLPAPPARSNVTVRRPDLTPPLPGTAALAAAGATAAASLFRRPTGREQPWAQIPADDRFETYEVPVTAGPGRYLWLVLDLTGTPGLTPRVRELRVEHPGHRLLQHLPRAWSRDEADADFLQRFLAPLDGLLRELDNRAVQRALLIDPSATPQEALSWLAGFAGLALDRRWPEAARRELIAEAYVLFARRGTMAMLTRILSIYLGYPPVLVERWRLRGVPGAVLGAGPGSTAPARLGATVRTGGSLGDGTALGAVDSADGYTTAAHRFSVLIPADLSREQRDVVEKILADQRPAHTEVEICELGFGMRVGRHLHLALTSVVGSGARWGPAVVGSVAVGGDGVVGVPPVREG
ncbi:phage tail protein [Streptomyces phaeochromogenes]|uniref:phage tail protein n=1 Tax=Streptomyces phaeochromogenes TaxID=1923 RepID=UPI002E0F6715|nr:phage tail protein [Streptomyces phaeochromogenes]